jgi:hypothetical protein
LLKVLIGWSKSGQTKPTWGVEGEGAADEVLVERALLLAGYLVRHLALDGVQVPAHTKTMD